MENAPRKRRASIRHSLASTFSFASLSALRRHPSLPPTITSPRPPLVTTMKSSPASTPKPQTTRTPNLVPIVSERVPIITVHSPPRAQMEDASDEERPWSGGGWKRRERRTTINDARFLALLTMDISHPVLLGSSYSGDVRDLPGHRRDEANDQSAGGDGDASVKEVVDLLERVEQEFGIATARVGEGVKDVREEIIYIKRQQQRQQRHRQRQWRKVRRVEERI